MRGEARYLLYFACNLVRGKCDTGSGPPAFGSGRLTVRLELDGDWMVRQDALKIQERHFAKDVAGRGKSNLTVRGVSIIRETLSLSLSLSLARSLSRSLSLSPSNRTARTHRLVRVRAAGERKKGGLGGVRELCLCSLPDFDDVVKQFCPSFLAVRTYSFSSPNARRNNRFPILSFYLSLSLFFLTPERGRAHISNSTLMKEARLLMLYYLSSPYRVDAKWSAQGGPLQSNAL